MVRSLADRTLPLRLEDAAVAVVRAGLKRGGGAQWIREASIFNVLTPTTILALSPVILLTVFLATVIFGIPGWEGQSLIKELGI